MCDMIDLVVVKISETPKWQYIPPASATKVIAELEAPYIANISTVYSSSEAVALMELTGRKLGEVSEWSSSSKSSL